MGVYASPLMAMSAAALETPVSMAAWFVLSGPFLPIPGYLRGAEENLLLASLLLIESSLKTFSKETF